MIESRDRHSPSEILERNRNRLMCNIVIWIIESLKCNSLDAFEVEARLLNLFMNENNILCDCGNGHEL